MAHTQLSSLGHGKVHDLPTINSMILTTENQKCIINQ